MKPTFQSLYTHYKLDNDALFALAKQAGVGKSITDVMIVGSPVERTDAEKILAALSQMTGERWALDNVHVPLSSEGTRYG